jgi:hypothetical protein
MIRRFDCSTVPTTTMNMTPTSAAIGIISIHEARNSTNRSRQTAAVTPLNRRGRRTLLLRVYRSSLMRRYHQALANGS